MPITKWMKEKWIERLEDPNSKKAIGNILDKKTGGMCCLGHLADINGDLELAQYTNTLGIGMYGNKSPTYGLTVGERDMLSHLNDTEPGFPIGAIRELEEIPA